MNQLKPVLAFMKAQIFLIVCAVVALLAIVSLWWPFGAMGEDTKAKMDERYKAKSSVDMLKNSTIVFTGLKYIDENGKEAPAPPGVIVQALTQLKKRAIDQMADQKTRIEAMAARGNRKNRVDTHGDPLFAGKALRGYLPQKAASYHLFRDENYRGVFDEWTKRLVNQNDVTAGVVPALATYREAFKKEQDQRELSIPADLRGKRGYEAGLTDEGSYIRDALVARAGSTAIYLSPDSAFQRRDFINRTSEPTEREVFEAFVDSWLQNDVVEAIRGVNGKSTEVGTSKVKHLLAISIGDLNSTLTAFGNGVRSGPSSVFGMTPGMPQDGPGMYGGAPPMGPPPGGMYGGPPMGGPPGGMYGGPPGMPPTQRPTAPVAGTTAMAPTMTGRTSNADYDVWYMTVTLVAEPAAVNAFIDALYRQNNGYTVINRKEVGVDPYDAISHGFIYGKTQCVQVDLHIEVLFFQDWMAKITPASVKPAGL